MKKPESTILEIASVDRLDDAALVGFTDGSVVKYPPRFSNPSGNKQKSCRSQIISLCRTISR